MKKVLLVADVPYWAWHRRALGIQRYAPESFQVDICMEKDITRDKVLEYEAVLAMSWPTFGPLDAGNVYAMVANEGLMYPFNMQAENWRHRTASKSKNVGTATFRLPKFKGVITINPKTVDFCRGFNENTTYLDTGVDHNEWIPTSEAGKGPSLTVGWSGKPCDGPRWSPKGYEHVLVPLMQRFRGDSRIQWRLNPRTHADRLSTDEMKEWYNSIDLFLCTSSSEGTPSSLMEAMSCGRPFLSTEVGIVRKLWSTQSSSMPGWIVPGYRDESSAQTTVSSLYRIIHHLLGHPKQLAMAAVAARSVIEQKWNWEQLSESWCERLLT